MYVFDSKIQGFKGALYENFVALVTAPVDQSAATSSEFAVAKSSPILR